MATRQCTLRMRYGVAAAEASARPAARRRRSGNNRKYEPCRSLGIASPTVPARDVSLPRAIAIAGIHPLWADLPYPALQYDVNREFRLRKGL